MLGFVSLLLAVALVLVWSRRPPPGVLGDPQVVAAHETLTDLAGRLMAEGATGDAVTQVTVAPDGCDGIAGLALSAQWNRRGEAAGPETLLAFQIERVARWRREPTQPPVPLLRLGRHTPASDLVPAGEPWSLRLRLLPRAADREEVGIDNRLDGLVEGYVPGRLPVPFGGCRPQAEIAPLLARLVRAGCCSPEVSGGSGCRDTLVVISRRRRSGEYQVDLRVRGFEGQVSFLLAVDETRRGVPVRGRVVMDGAGATLPVPAALYLTPPAAPGELLLPGTAGFVELVYEPGRSGEVARPVDFAALLAASRWLGADRV